MIFNINEKSLTKLKDVGVNTENFGSVLIALKAFKDNDLDLLDFMDDHMKERRAIVLYQNMERLGLIEESKGQEVYYEVTPLGLDVLDTVIEKLPIADGLEWVKEWLELFPKGVKTGGKLIRSDLKGCMNKMRSFIKDYPQYSIREIFDATQQYLDKKEQDEWAYTRAAIYFIGKKGEGSDLASWCENLNNSVGDLKEVKSDMI